MNNKSILSYTTCIAFLIILHIFMLGTSANAQSTTDNPGNAKSILKDNNVDVTENTTNTPETTENKWDADLDKFNRLTIGKVTFYARRFTGRIEKIRMINGYPNFIQNAAWLKKYIRIKSAQVFNPLRVSQDKKRLLNSGLFENVKVQGRKDKLNYLSLRYIIKSKPVKDVKFIPDTPLTESTASLTTRISTRQGEEYTQSKARDDIRILNTQKQNISHITVYANILRFPDGKYDDGVTVYYFFNENPFLNEVILKGVDIGSSKDIKKELESMKSGFDNTDIIEQDINRIKKYYLEKKGCYFTEVTYEVKKIIENDRVRRILYFNIFEGPRTSVRALTFNGLEKMCPPEGDTFFEPPTKWWGLWYSIAFWANIEDAKKRPLKYVLKGNDDYNPEELSRDCHRLEDLLRGHGWLDAKVYLSDLKFSDDRKDVDATFEIEPGPLYWVRSITFKGNFTVFSQKDILEKLRVKTGMPYKQMMVDGKTFEQAYEGDRKYIERMFKDKGYYGTTVKSEIVFISPSKIDLVYTITQGDRKKIGNIFIHGNEVTKTNVILERMELRPGLYYSESTREGDVARLLRTQFFELSGLGVRIVPKTSTAPFDPKKYVDLDVYVKEGDTGSFNFGVAYSTNSGILFFVQVTKRNFDIGNWSTFSGAGQTISLNLSPGIDSQSSYSLSFNEPYFFGSRFSFGFNLVYSENAYTSYSQRDWIASTTWGYRLMQDLTANFTYRWNWFRGFDIDSDAPSAIKEAEKALVMSSIGLELSWDKRNDIFFPTKGVNVVLNGEVAGRYLGGNIDLWRVGARASLHIPLMEVEPGEDLTFSLRSAFDWQKPYGETEKTPILQRYYLGGAGGYKEPQMRGFAYRGVGPRDTGEAIGGDARICATAELRYPLKLGLIYFVLFLDIGQLQPKIEDLRMNRWNMSWGFGFRLRVPISPAPLALDFGFPIKMFPGDEEQTVSFTLGFNF